MNTCTGNGSEVYYRDFKDLSNRDLERKKEHLEKDKKRSLCFSGLYIAGAIGSVIATVFTGGFSAAGTIPAATVSCVCAGDNIDKCMEYSEQIDIINDIIEKREKVEIAVYNNKNAVTIINHKYDSNKKI